LYEEMYFLQMRKQKVIWMKWNRIVYCVLKLSKFSSMFIEYLLVINKKETILFSFYYFLVQLERKCDTVGVKILLFFFF